MPRLSTGWKERIALVGLAGVGLLAVRRTLRERTDRQATDPAGAPAGSAARSDEPTVEAAEPPAPDWAYDVLNPVMERLLRSPLHGLVSDSVALITFTGRKTGAEYTTPVGYLEEDGRVVVFTHSDWWKNLRGGRPVRLRIRGEEREGVAEPTNDPAEVADHVERYLEREGVGNARRLGLRIEGEGMPDRPALEDALAGTVAIEVELEGEAVRRA
ncbi:MULTISPECIES: nitroreductase/quinone reductase family protein [Halorussus]|uniref:nitroreductase/quinone reductase family protein n=1 Tax=Halorussus TaxID=1070314 RepID=UPI0020A1369D|nr:nitroreductase/quinone reductase family protein [Halorussus vallis]USZ74849.1 nitroreductase family deazaflavin-dependent oxidoreductase [Halorussus vallis]